MKKSYICFLFIVVMLFWTCIVKAENLVDTYNDDEDIYFCTKDLDVLNAVATKIPENYNTDKGKYCATNKLDSELLTKFRHCFLMIARKIKGNDDFYYLKSDQAPFGYGSEGSGSSSSSSSSESSRSLSPSSSDSGSSGSSPPSKQGKARAEMINLGTAIACVSVLGQDDIRNKPVDGEDKQMFYWWTVIQNHMHSDAKSRLYDTFNHNCCTVASDAIKKAGGHLENINFASFNEGYGTIDREGISLLGFVGLTASFSSEVSSASSSKLFNFIFRSGNIKGSEICRDYSQHDVTNTDTPPSRPPEVKNEPSESVDNPKENKQQDEL